MLLNTLIRELSSIVISIFIAVIVGFAIHSYSKSDTSIVPYIALSFTFFKSIVDIIKNYKISVTENKGKLDLLQRWSAEKIRDTRLALKKKNISSITENLGSLEFLVTKIGQCCYDRVQKDRFQVVKGTLSTTKTTFSKAANDATIEKPFNDANDCLSKVETYINDF